jgi:hypothetical protein
MIEKIPRRKLHAAQASKTGAPSGSATFVPKITMLDNTINIIPHI